MRAVFDPNVIISTLLSSSGAPARLLEMWARGTFELIVSEVLLAEVERALRYPKLVERIDAEARTRLLDLLRGEAELASDPSGPLARESIDPGDNYLIAPAELPVWFAIIGWMPVRAESDEKHHEALRVRLASRGAESFRGIGSAQDAPARRGRRTAFATPITQAQGDAAVAA